MKIDGKTKQLILKNKLSALMDGELDKNEQSTLLAELKTNPQLQETWQRYHLISNILQRNNNSNPVFNLGLHTKVQAAIINEALIGWGAEFNTPIVMNTTQLKDIVLGEKSSTK
ncbi:MAG: sigma-E factor negative regulatory protein [Proteobacteria bacterium]|nr:sigma-E factor negative regulatory protein [Pseudomonadota bacterium]